LQNRLELFFPIKKKNANCEGWFFYIGRVFYTKSRRLNLQGGEEDPAIHLYPHARGGGVEEKLEALSLFLDSKTF